MKRAVVMRAPVAAVGERAVKRVVVILALLAPLVRIELAEAGGSCGGAHGSGGGAGGGGGWASHGGSAACDPADDIAGFRRCRPFAAWARRPHAVHLIFEGGLTMRRFDTLLANQAGTVSHANEAFRFRVSTLGPGRPHEDAMLATFRGVVGMPYGVYAGAELGIGGLVRRAASETEMMSSGVFGSPELAAHSSMIVDSLAVAGVRGQVGPGTLGVELAGGVRSVSYSFQSTYHDCVQITDVTAIGAVVEARARGELWVTPWITAGATVGTSLLERGAWMGGLFLGVHTRAFDQAR